MTDITIYDDTAHDIEKLAEALDWSVAEVIDALMEYSDEIYLENQ